jgi:hypothetical protein
MLVSVPCRALTLILQLQSYEDLELHWAAEMALRLLQARHASSSSSSSTPSDASSPAFWGPWVKSLPQRVVTPVDFTTEEVQQLVIPSTVQVRVAATLGWFRLLAGIPTIPGRRGGRCAPKSVCRQRRVVFAPIG